MAVAVAVAIAVAVTVSKSGGAFLCVGGGRKRRISILLFSW